MKPLKTFELILGITFTFFIVLLLGMALSFSSTKTLQKDVLFINDFTYKNSPITLPYTFTDLDPRTPISIETMILPGSSDSIYIKSVYAPLNLYLDDVLFYEYGKSNTYPNFMIDPATSVSIVPLPNILEEAQLRMEFLSPISRDVLTVHPPILGTSHSIISYQMSILGIPLIFSILQFLYGVLLVFSSVLICRFEKKGITFTWLGLFSISTGIWSIGEYNLTGLLIDNPTLLYLMAFIGLFSILIPIYQFSLEIIMFQNPKPLQYISYFLTIICIFAYALQLGGILNFSTSMFLFHIILPIGLSFLTIYVLIEYLRFKDKNAFRFLFPTFVLSISSILEVINYNIHFTYIFSSIFQIGILCFTFSTILIGSCYIKDLLQLKRNKQQLESQMKLMEIQICEQKKYNLLMTHNSETLKQQRHDLKHQLRIIRELGADNLSITNYIDELIDNIPASQGSFCNHYTVNAIITHYATLCTEKNITFTCSSFIPKELKQISDSDLCIIFGNLLENAVEACGRIPNQENFIKLKTALQHDTLVITMDNSFSGHLKIVSDRFYSSKRNDYGIGLSSIHAIVAKHGGNANFCGDGTVFLSSLYLKI